MSIKEKISKKTPYKIRRLHGKYKGIILDREEYKKKKKWEKRRERRGNENPDKYFYVIRREPNSTGLLSIYLQAIGKLKEMDDSCKLRKYIPIIDLETDFFHLCDDNENIHRNAWELYFERVSDYSVRDISSSKNILLSDGQYALCGKCFFDNSKIDKFLLSNWYTTDSKYFKLLPELEKEYEETREKLFGTKRVLGVMIRDGYAALSQANNHLVNGHPRQPSIDQLYEKIDSSLSQYSFDYVFLVAETESINKTFKEKYGERFLSTDRERSVYKIEDGKVINLKLPKSRVKSNIDYLEEIYLLSKCAGLIAGKCSGSIVAALWNKGKYDILDILQLGSY